MTTKKTKTKTKLKTETQAKPKKKNKLKEIERKSGEMLHEDIDTEGTEAKNAEAEISMAGRRMSGSGKA